jgi:hypothetical protein
MLLCTLIYHIRRILSIFPYQSLFFFVKKKKKKATKKESYLKEVTSIYIK